MIVHVVFMSWLRPAGAPPCRTSEVDVVRFLHARAEFLPAHQPRQLVVSVCVEAEISYLQVTLPVGV